MLFRYLLLCRRHEAVLRAMFAGTAMITVACLLREIEFEPEGSLGWLDRLVKGPIRWIAVVLAIPVVIYSIRGVLRDPLAVPRLVLGTRWGLCSVVGGLAIVLGAVFDRGLLPSTNPYQAEELSETIGYLLIAVSTFIPPRVANSVVSSRHGDDRPSAAGPPPEPAAASVTDRRH